MWNCYCQEHQGIVSTLLNPVADSQSSSELNPELLTDTAHHTLLSSFAFQAPDPPGFPPPSLTNHSFPFSLADIPDFKTKTQSNNFFIYPLFLGDILSRLIMALNTNYTLLTQNGALHLSPDSPTLSINISTCISNGIWAVLPPPNHPISVMAPIAFFQLLRPKTLKSLLTLLFLSFPTSNPETPSSWFRNFHHRSLLLPIPLS